jgi:group I intron endonuclease
MSVIYEFVNTINNKVYVGQTKDFKSRIRCHRHNSRSYKKTNPFYNAIRKYGWDNFTINIIEECNIKSINDREEYWIREKKSLYPNGYNLMKGGNQYEMSEDTKRKLSQIRKGIKFSPEHIENLRKSHLGNKLSEETKRKLSKINKGKIHTEEVKIKLRYSNPNRKEVGRFDCDNNLICKYDSIKLAAKEFNVLPCKITECCQGKRKMKKILGTDTLRYLTTKND